MTRLLLLAWAVCIVMAAISFRLTVPNDFGFTRGINRLEAAAPWALAALFLAFWSGLRAGRHDRGTGIRRLALLPLVVTLVAVGALAAVIFRAARDGAA